VQVKRAWDRGPAGGVYLVLPTSLRFPCGGRLEGGGRCRANWNVETARLQVAYRWALGERRPELVFPFDL
jgi:hypothetical protein